MKRGGILAMYLVGGLAVAPVASAVLSDQNPYRAIVARNAFALVPPPPPPPITPPVAPTAPPNIKLTGIVTLFGTTRAHLMLQPVGQGAKTDPSYLALREGQQQGEVQVVSIDSKAGRVGIKVNGQPSVLDFKKDGIKVAALPTIPAPGVRPPLPAMPIPAPRGQERPVRGGEQIPKMTPEVQTIAIEVERARLQQAGDETANLLPPTELTPDNSSGGPEGP